MVRMLKTVEDDGDDMVGPLDITGTVPPVKVVQGTTSVVVVTNVEPCAFVVVYSLVVVV